AEPLNGCVIDITYSDSFFIRNGRSRLVNCRSQMSERRFHVLTCQGDSECVYGDFTPTHTTPVYNVAPIRRLALLRSLVLLSVCLASCEMRAQSPTEADTNSRPTILGTLDKGAYSNRVIGFEIQLDPVCTITNEARAIERANQFPPRLSLT